MPLDASKPADTDLVSQLAGYQRETRAYVNSIETVLNLLSGAAVSTSYNCAVGQSDLPVGNPGLGDIPIEMVFITGTGVAVVDTISGARNGQIKIFRLGDANISFALGGNFILNQPIAAPPYGGTIGDMIALVNYGGNPNTSADGVWYELWRTPYAP
jgi:hypothetical protein